MGLPGGKQIKIFSESSQLPRSHKTDLYIHVSDAKKID